MQLEGMQFDHYYIVRLLKRGGMGDIYLANDEKLSRQVAIKVIRADTDMYTDEEEARDASRLFIREAQVVAKLDHNHILPLYDAGEKRIGGMLLLYMVMPLREEGCFTDWLHKHGYEYPLTPRVVERVIRQAANALQYAHDRKIMHLDVKPSNFLVRDDVQHPGHIYLQLADFGVAKLITTTSHSRSQIIRGTPMHMPPEQWENRPVPASDQYALAVMAYEMLTGYPPFESGNHQQMWFQHSHINPEPPSSLNSSLPPELDEVLLRALAKAPQVRYSSISAFALAFRQALLETGNVRQQLIISEDEARQGIQRIIHITGRRQFTVDIPPGVQDGQELFFEGQGITPMNGGPPGALILTIFVTRTQRSVVLSDTGHLPQTLIAQEPAFYDIEESLPVQHKRVSLLGTILPIVLAFMLVLGGFTAIASSLLNNGSHTTPQNSNSNRGLVHKTKTDTSIPHNTTTPSQVSATLTAQAGATTQAQNAAATNTAATVTAQQHINATQTVTAGQTATARTQATGTATAYNRILNNGTPVLNDPMQGNSTDHPWDTNYTASSGGCEFVNNVYHNIEPQAGTTSPCFVGSISTANHNFMYEMQVQISQGDEGGITFRADSTNDNFYCFYFDTQGNYYLDLYDVNNPNYITQIKSGYNSAIHTAAGQSNVLAAQLKGNLINLYINESLVDTIPLNSQTTLSSSQVGVVAISVNNPTDVIFSNALLVIQP